MTTQGFRFSVALQEMAASEIMEMVDAATLKEIKATDPHPLIKAFVVGHEGESKGNMVGIGNVVKRWMKAMVRTLGAKIRAGLQLFSGHAATNSHEGRIAIGQVVGSRTRQHEGRESVIVACHIKPEYRHLPLDVASVETNVAFEQKADGSLEITEIADVTAIALGNSAIDKPGFPGATLLGQLQAFEEQHGTRYGYKAGLRLGYGSNTTIRLAKPEEETH